MRYFSWYPAASSAVQPGTRHVRSRSRPVAEAAPGDARLAALAVGLRTARWRLISRGLSSTVLSLELLPLLLPLCDKAVEEVAGRPRPVMAVVTCRLGRAIT